MGLEEPVEVTWVKVLLADVSAEAEGTTGKERKVLFAGELLA